MPRRLVALLLILAPTLSAANWRVELPLDQAQRSSLELDALDRPLGIGDELVLAAAWSQLSRTVWLEVCLLTSDQRYYASAIPLAAAPDREGAMRIPLASWAWSGPDGPLDADGLAGVRRLWLRTHGSDGIGGSLPATLKLVRATDEADEKQRRIQLLGAGTHEHAGGWRELRFRVLGPPLASNVAVDLVLADGRRIPCFLQRRLAPHLGRMRSRGPGYWVARLRSDEAPLRGWEVEIGGWRSPAMPAIPPAPDTLDTPATSTPLTDRTPAREDHLVVIEPGAAAVRRRIAAQAAIAPHLRWRDEWTGFRGPDLASHHAAAALDAALVAGAEAVDLLPQSLFEEHGTFRFGLSPWHRDHGGSWRWPQDLYRDDDAIDALLEHAGDIVARCRAAPRLTQWRVSCHVPTGDDDQRRRLATIVERLRELVSDDPRPLVVDHPQAVPYDPRRVDQQPWLDFERDTDGFSSRLGPLSRSGEDPSHGGMALRVPVPPRADGPALELLRELDANVFNLDRLEFDARLRGDGGLQLYAWVTDEHHRWYQQRLVLLRAGAPWRTVGIAFDDHARWQPVGHTTPWDGSQRRRLRRVGLMGFAHQRTEPGPLDLDRFVRYGWPAEDEPRLNLVAIAPDATRLRCHQTLTVDFGLDQRSQNPYDPEQADVVGEVIAPDGSRFIHPAYWYEAVDLEPGQRHEVVRRSGASGWRWHLAPDVPGTWRWRLVARIRYRERWLETEGDWRELTVAPAADDALLPIRRSADPRWFERSDGDWFYPIGMNLRSPGDERQDHVLADAGVRERSRDYEALGTAAFDRWFERMREHGMNFARVWMSPWFCGLEWTREWDDYGGLTWYNQIHAAQLDQVMAAARRHGVYLQLELQNHGMTAPRVDSQWRESPYNAANGGPCRSAEDFFTSEAAWAAHAKRLRYTIARWGHHSHLMCWVLSSEMEFTGAWWEEAYRAGAMGHSPSTEAWIRRSLEWLERNDRSGRPVSVHFSHPWRAVRLWREVDGLAFNYSNAYTGFREIAGEHQRLDLALANYLDQKFPPWTLGRPTLIGEWGGHWVEKSHHVLDAELRAGTWMQAVLPYGGNTGFWWWLWVDATDHWGDYAAIARFVAGEDPRGRDLRSRTPATSNQAVRMLGMAGRDRQRYYAWRVGSSRHGVIPPLENGGSADIEVPPDSRWLVVRHDCATGEAIDEAVLQGDERGLLRLPLGRLAPDVAFKLEPAPDRPINDAIPWAP